MFLICIAIIAICLIATPKLEQKSYQQEKLKEYNKFWEEYNAEKEKTEKEFKEKWGKGLYEK